MKYTINHIQTGEEELLLNYKEKTDEVERILLFMSQNQKRMRGKVGEETILFSSHEIMYIEKVDDKTFAYTKNQVIQLEVSLAAAEVILDSRCFFRCSKSMILNISKVIKLKSLPSNRIDVMIEGGEHIIISRTYASDFRKKLKGDN